MGGKTTTISNSETRAEALKLQSSSYGATVAVVHGKARIAGNLLDYGNFQAIAHTDVQEMGGKGGGGVRTESTTYTYVATVLMGLCEGPIQDVTAIWAGKRKHVDRHGPGGTEDILIYGNVEQAAWSGLNSMASSDHALGYSGIAMFGVLDYELGGSAEVPNHNFEVVGRGAYQVHSTLPDADVSLIVKDWIQHNRYGRGLTFVTLGGLADLSTWSKASGLMFSPALTEQAPAADRINQLCDMANVAVVPSDGALNFVVLATEPVTRTLTAVGGATTTLSYEPDITPLFELSADQIMPEPGQPRIKVIRKTPADIYNIVKVEFRNRNNDYAIDVAVVEDRANVDLFGPLLAPTLKADWICDHQVAQIVGRMKLQRYLTQLREYEFVLPWNYSDILPTNLLLINDEDQGVTSVLVRVKQLTETDSGWNVRAVDCPAVQSAAPLYALPAPDGYKHRYIAAPGNTVIGAVFEAPFDLTTTGLEVWAAISGTNSDWGGAHIWVSLDGVNYRRVGTNFGSSRYGRLSGAISGGTVGITNVVGKVLSGTAQEAVIKSTLCYIGGSAPEWLSYATATLASANAYTLSGLVRAQYGTFDSSSHAADDIWVRCDDALATSGPLELSLIGKQIYIKAPSFNVFGLQTQDLADVTATTYTITGRFSFPTPDPANQIKNGTFESQAVGQQPDGWNDGAIVEVTGQSFTRAMQFDGETVVASNMRIPARAGDKLWFGGWGKAYEPAKSFIYFRYRFYAANGDFISLVNAALFEWGRLGANLSGNIIPGATYGWIYRTGVVDVPSGAAYCIPEASLNGTAIGAVHPSFLSQLVVRRQITTNDIQAGSATSVYRASNKNTVVVTEPEFGSGDASRQVLQTISVTTTVPCSVLVTAFADGVAQSSTSGFSGTNGGAVTIRAYIPTSTSTNATNQASNYSSVGTPGGGVATSGSMKLSDIMQMQAGTWNVELRCSKTSTDMTCSISDVQFRVEIIKL